MAIKLKTLNAGDFEKLSRRWGFFAFGVRGLWVRLLHREIAQKCVICALGLRAWVKFGYNTKAAVAAEAANKVSLLRLAEPVWPIGPVRPLGR